MIGNFLNDSETIDDVTRAAVLIVKRIMTDVESLEPTFAKAELIRPLLELACKVGTEPELTTIAPIVLTLLSVSNLRRDESAMLQVRLSWHVFDICGIDLAL